MSGADDTVSVTLPSEYYPTTVDGIFEDNEPCWCIECGWDGLEDELMFTNEGVFVCPQCSSEDTDYYYSEESHSCVFCGSDDVVGVIDIVSLNEIHEATPLDKEQVYGYCARCADVKMAEGSTGDQIVSWEDSAGVSSPSMPPSDIKWAESKKDRIASGRAMHYAIPSEKKYPIWDKAHARMALAWSQGTKYADKVEKAVTKRFPTMNAETVYKNYPGRKGPSLSATSVKRGTRKRGNDGKMWEVRKSGRSQRWFRGAESFEALGEPDAPYDQGYDDQQDESLGERNVTTGEQSLKDRRDEADAMDKKTGRKYHDVSTMDKVEEGKTCPACGNYGYWGGTRKCPPCAGLMPGIDMDALRKEARAKMGRKKSEHHKGQGYDDEMDESLGMRNRVTGEQSFKDRRDEASAMDKGHTRMGRKYDDVAAMDAESDAILTRYGIAKRSSIKPDWIIIEAGDDDVTVTRQDSRPDPVKFVKKVLEPSGWDIDIDEDISARVDGGWDIFPDDTSDPFTSDEGVRYFFAAIPLSSIGSHWDGDFNAENMGLTQYVGSAGGSSQGTPVSYGGMALPESDVAALVATDNPMDATIGTVTGTMGAEEVPVVPDPSSFPQGYGKVLGQQIDQANLSPLHAEGFGCGCPGGICTTESDDWWDCDPEGRGGRCGECPECIHNNFSGWGAEEDVQMVKIQNPVMTGAKMALGVVALNATAIGGAALIALAIAHTARREE